MTWPADDSATSVAAFLANLQTRTNGLLNGHRAAARPTYLTAGSLWVDSSGATDVVRLFDGTNDIDVTPSYLATGASGKLTVGDEALALSDGAITHGGQKIVTQGDAQSVRLVQNVRTTDATPSDLGPLMIAPAGHRTSGMARVMLTAMRDGSADANNDGDYTTVGYSLEFGFWTDQSTSGHLFASGSETAVTGAPTLDMVELAGNTNNDFDPGGAPHVAFEDGELHAVVTGLAATEINWVASFDAVMTLVA